MKPPLEKIMLVEDDGDIRTVAAMSLEMVGGLKVLACESGEAALEELASFAPQLVLLDVMMPGMNGPEVLVRMRATPEGETVPVAFMTARVQPEEIRNLLAIGAIDVIAKPFDPMTLPDQVKALWERE
jgi:two-component system, OmpR family, response regulator